MANKRIEDLPTLPTDTKVFDPSADYVLIQKPGGASYKMVASNFISQAISFGQYSDASSISINTNENAGNRISFQANNLLSQNSNFVINTFAGGNMSTIIKQSGNLLINGIDGLIPSDQESYQLIGGGDFYVFATLSFNNQEHSIVFENIYYSIASGSTYTSTFNILGSQPLNMCIQANIAQ